ncbi:MAG: hypothetical protein E6J85_18135 [Deltaproteobacteria bacterium]|nr:MAG: hypothetical protein E6J85_18135 [Deltaproteobacteria bacterium]
MPRRLAQSAVLLVACALLAFAWRCDGPWFANHVFLPQQFFLPAGSGIVVGFRAAAVTAAALLLLVVPRVPRGASAGRLVLGALLSLPAAEIVLRWRIEKVIRPDLLAATADLTARHPRYGTTFRPSMDRVEVLSAREIRFQTDGEGRRIPGAAIDPAAPSLVFTGESAMAGFGLRWEETFAALLGARLRLQVVNLASPSYRIDQSWLRLADALPKLERPVAVVGVFMPGLVGRSFAGQLHPPAHPLPFAGFEFVPPQPPGLLERSGLFRTWSHLYRSDAAIEEGMRSVGAVLSGMASLAKARGLPCVFLVTGYTPRWMLHELFEAPGLDFVVVDLPQDELLEDGHPGPRGAIRIAAALESRLRAKLARR